MTKKFVFLFLLFPIFLRAQTPAAYERAGDASMQRGDYYSASTFYYKAFLEMSEDASVAFKLGESCRLFNDYENAERYYVRTITLDREEKIPLARFRLAEMKQFQGEYDDAKKLYSSYYSHHITDSSYYTLKAKQQAENCDYAKELLKDTLKCDINNLGSDINTVYSDFAAQLVDSTKLFYSSLRFENQDKKAAKKNKYVSKILKSENENKLWSVPLPMADSINRNDLHNCNSSISPDKKIMVFTRCTQVGDKLMCELYQSKNQSGSWSTPEKLSDSINGKGFTSTQPWLTVEGFSGYTLYFVTDRPGGFGKLDIWKSSVNATGVFSAPVNLGATINTVDDDITPFFDNKTQTLYFSSDGHKGMGGYDIFKSAYVDGNYSAPENAGNPLNSSYNEVYFTVATDTKYLFSSNRPGSLYIKARTCCYDIYECVLKQPVVKVKKVDSLDLITTKPTEIETKPELEIVQVYKALLPLKLYFENDQPDPKTLKTTTDKNYVSLYNSYLQNQPAYLSNYTSNIAEAEKAGAEKKVNDFFSNIVIKSFSDLERFTSIMTGQLKDSNKIELIIRGSASPLADNSYNKNLSKRRISSLLNYWKSSNQNELISYLKSGKLKIIEEAVGEDLASKNISDNLKDKRNSVYSPEASSLRYIEVLKVRVNGIETK